jgi:hypothetical protein
VENLSFFKKIGSLGFSMALSENKTSSLGWPQMR